MNTKKIIVGVAVCTTLLCLGIGGIICHFQSNAAHKHISDARYFVRGLLIDTNRNISYYPYCQKDTVWIVAVYFNRFDDRPLDTTFYAPSSLPKNGYEAMTFFGNENILMAYAERKRIKKFCYKDSLGIMMFVHLKENENFKLSSAEYGVTEKAVDSPHKEGWAKIIVDIGYWKGNTLVLPGHNLCMANGADAIIPCQNVTY